MSPEVEQLLRDIIFCAQNTYDPQIGVYAARAAKLLRSENPATADANQGHRPASASGAGRFLVEREGVDGIEYYAEDVHGCWVKNWREADILTKAQAHDAALWHMDVGAAMRPLSEVEAENAGCGL